jgi:hypothetical protein
VASFRYPFVFILLVPFLFITGVKFCQSPHFIPKGFEAQLEIGGCRGFVEAEMI